ncbi:colicin transporter [Xylanimonas oleitrophica]|uniref:Colicin transporter n=1 Tax=Xylanimonas oleitrophica TaxID=2607479 RepID=A0A2W5WXL7_9MICO|nr:SAV_6107 family HEPN domain-containing protein [Xylanimonas oleitrophica]PZR55433.1 colicin transporter [Xylanimonas oleitrophica]
MTLKHTARRRATHGTAVPTPGTPAVRAAEREVSAGPRVVPAEVARLLALADAELAQAAGAGDPADRFVHGHLAALRAAAAVVALRGRPGPRSGARTVWEMLSRVEPDLATWSVYFASGARLRAAVDAGHGEEVEAARADELVACAEDFRDEVAILVDPDAGFSRPLRLTSAAS